MSGGVRRPRDEWTELRELRPAVKELFPTYAQRRDHFAGLVREALG